MSMSLTQIEFEVQKLPLNERAILAEHINKAIHIFVFLLFLISIPCFSATRIAIVSDSQDKLQDMLTVELSSNSNIELLERMGIAKVLTEQKMTGSLLDEKQAITLGKLLSADLFVVIEGDSENKSPIGVIVFDSHTGVRYWDSPLPDAGMDAVAKRISEWVKTAIVKHENANSGKLKYVSLLSVHNMDLPKDNDCLCTAVGVLMMRILGNSPGIAVLERSHLDWINRERNLPGMEGQNKLLGSIMNLGLEFNRTNEVGQVKATLLIPGNEKIVVNVPVDKPLPVAEELSWKFLDRFAIESSNIIPGDIGREADRFYREFLLMKEISMLQEATERISAAYALNPDRKDIASAYMDALTYLADIRIYRKNKFDEGLDLMEAALDLSRKLYVDEAPFKDNVNFRIFSGSNNIVRNETHSNNLSYDGCVPITLYQKLSQDQRDRIEKLHSEWLGLRRQALSAYYLKDKKDFARDPRQFQDYSEFVWRYTSEPTYNILYDEKWMKDCLPEIEKWIDIAAEYCGKSGQEISDDGRNVLSNLQSFLRCQVACTAKHEKEFSNLFEKMKNHPSFFVKADGLYLEFILQRNVEFFKHNLQKVEAPFKFREQEIEILRNIYPAYLEKCKAAIEGLPKSVSPGAKEEYYYIICDPLPDSDYKYDMLLPVFDFMIQRKEISSALTFGSLIVNYQWKDHPEICIEIFEKARELAKSGDFCLLPSAGEIGRRLLGEEQHYLNALAKCGEKPPSLPWEKTQVLLDFKGKKDRMSPWIMAYCVSPDGKYAYVAKGIEEFQKNGVEKEKAVHLLRVSVEDGSVEEMTTYDFSDTFYYYNQIDYLIEPRSYSYKIEVWGDKLVMPSFDGILIFPLTGDKKSVTRLSKESGLPTNRILSACVLDKKIYALAGGEEQDSRSFLLCCDPAKSYQVEILDSSLRENNDKAFIPPKLEWGEEIFAFEGKNKLYAVINRSLAEYDLQNKSWKVLIPASLYIQYSHKLDEDHLLISGRDSCYVYEIQNADLEAIMADGNPPAPFKHKKAKLKSLKTGKARGFPHAVGEKLLWFGNLFQCCSLETGENQTLPHPAWHIDRNFFSMVLLELVDNGNKLLVGTDDGLFLLTLKDNYAPGK